MNTNLRITIDDLITCVLINARRDPGQDVCQYFSAVVISLADEQRYFYEEVIGGIEIVLKEILSDRKKVNLPLDSLKKEILNEAAVAAAINVEIPLDRSAVHKYGVPLDNFELLKNDNHFRMQLLMHLMETTTHGVKRDIGDRYTKQDIMVKAANELSNFKLDKNVLDVPTYQHEDDRHSLCKPLLRVIKT